MKSTKRVIHIHLGIKGGSERFLINLVNGLAERGVEQIVITLPDRVWAHEINSSVKIYETRISRSHIARFFINRRITKMIDEFKPQAMMSWMQQASRWIPKCDDLLTAARLGDYPERLDPFENCDRLVCNTPDIARHCTEIGWPDDRTDVISNFTVTQPCEPFPRAELDTPEDGFVILALGRLVGRKGFATLISALAETDTAAYLWLLGDGPDREDLLRQAEALNVADRVRMPGWIEDPAPYLAAADSFCIPSTHEPLGNVVLEAWAHNCPVVSTRSEGPSWLIEDNEDGLLVPIDDVAALAKAFNRLTGNPDLGPRLAAAGSEKLNREFDRALILDRYMDFFFNNS